ncbi:MAG: class I SAM-dependent methyltransferase [Bdellovibrionaceae bacterium]|nr:class I SAM-dependent methyltransferase [Pseudobdellovibrionaceae bacterium]
MERPRSDFFTKEHAELYDEKNAGLIPISSNLHFLMKLVLEKVQDRARVLSVGAGTGADILSLARVFPEWSFVAVEPSLSMLSVCKERVHAAGFSNRCEFVHGFAEDLPMTEEFDVVTSLLVAHFVKRTERLGFFESLTKRLKKGGYLINAEIGFDLGSAQFPSMLKNWESVQSLMGATPESLASLPRTLAEILAVLPNGETEEILRKAGIPLPVRFFQAFMISGWYGIKA